MPMVGWPAKGISATEVKISIGIIVGSSGLEGWRKTVSERLNSLAMACFWVWVRVGEVEEGMRTIARGLPVYLVEVNTSRVRKVKAILGVRWKRRRTCI